MMMLKCDMTLECVEPVTHIDEKGFVYCNHHGINRKNVRRCRKLAQWELRRLWRGEQISYRRGLMPRMEVSQ